MIITQTTKSCNMKQKLRKIALRILNVGKSSLIKFISLHFIILDYVYHERQQRSFLNFIFDLQNHSKT
ncbi:hypothetical protein VNO77_10540 [Canavalia gladiata]|uniref:Uncharacterized protein n=1 Tax=Canavalia gladiata TaxID=3824 RepID=A0AAN9QX65_CANGL